MSTLTQARLVPLSYRYLSMTTGRHINVEYTHGICGRIAHKQHKSETCSWTLDIRNRFKSDPVDKLNPLYTNSEFSPIESIRKYYQTICYTPEARPLSDRSSRRFFANSGDHHISVKQLYARQNDFQFERHLTRGTDSNLSSRHERYKKRGYRRQHENDNSSRQYSNGSRSCFAIMGILGVFGKATTGDIEEERAKLSDKQKMDKMKPIELKIAKGVLSMCDQDYTRANELFHEALRMAQDDQDEKQEEMILNLIAANYFESGDFEHAEKLFIDLMKRLISNGTAPTAPAILELSLKLASIYSKAVETHEKALKGFKFVINSLMQNLDDVLIGLETLDVQDLSEERRGELALLGWSYDWFAKHLLTVNDYNAAINMLQRALQISSKILGPLHDQTLILLNDVGTTLAMNNAPEEGRSFIKKAVEGAITSQSKELASFYVNLGLVNLRLKQLQEAKRYCEYSIELAKKNREHYNSLEVIELSRTCLNEVERMLEVDRQ